MEGQNIAPIYMEVSPAGACNHRCIFCALDFMGYQKRLLNVEKTCNYIADAACMGLMSVMYAGEGEPLLHPRFSQMVDRNSQYVAQALTTNGVLLREETAETILPRMAWIKISCNAGTHETYKKIHRGGVSDFARVMRNVERAIKIRNRNGYNCSIGLQMVLLKENEHEADAFTLRAEDVGADYAVIKPYSQHPASGNQAQPGTLKGKLKDRKIPVIYRDRAFDRQDKPKAYERCLALPFWSYLDTGGNVWGCSAHMGDDTWKYGNIYEQGFCDIWQSEYRRNHVKYVSEAMDISKCRVNCRMDVCNEYLWQLKHPGGHDAFI
jgi:MoaA/NifB/PqqE/SkfB family radical SAM enzyme